MTKISVSHGIAMAAGVAATVVFSNSSAIAGTKVISDVPDAGLPMTYAWAPMAPRQGDAETDVRVDNTIVRDRIRSSVDKALAAKGYTLSNDNTGAQMLVAYRIGIRDRTRTDVNPLPSYPYGASGCRFAACYAGGYNWGWWGPPDVSVTQYDYVEGRIIIDLSSNTPHKLLWRAMNDKRLDSNDSEQREIDKIVSKMLKKLPAPGVAD